jgi:exosome complex exonuclease DIS3/RRP44
MLRSKAFVKVTNKGSVVKVVREHYLRDDLSCGVKGCVSCQSIPMGTGTILMDPIEGEQAQHELFCSHDMPRIIIPDTNIFLHHVHLRYIHGDLSFVVGCY